MERSSVRAEVRHSRTSVLRHERRQFLCRPIVRRGLAMATAVLHNTHRTRNPWRSKPVADPQAPTAFADENLPTSFYLGCEYDPASKAVRDRRVDYESKDLVTHGVVVGMTGSGK